MKEDKPYLMHILDAIEDIREFCKGIGKEEFAKNKLVRDATIRQLEIIGEAAKLISPEFKDRYIELPWGRISGMRDKLIHGYAGVNYEIVWDTIENDLPGLEKKLEEAVKKL